MIVGLRRLLFAFETKLIYFNPDINTFFMQTDFF